MPSSRIAGKLTDMQIATPGRKSKWTPATVESILTNEKYKGEARLQKTFVSDFLTKRIEVNNGVIPQYYVHNSHPAIIEPELFDLVQHEIAIRRASGRYQSSLYSFSGKLLCETCGGVFGSKVWHSNTKYRRKVWQCNGKHDEKKCQSVHLTDEAVQDAFIRAMNSVLGKRDILLEVLDEALFVLTDTGLLENEQAVLDNECDIVFEAVRKLIDENASVALDQEKYQERYNDYMKRYMVADERRKNVVGLIQERSAKRCNMLCFMNSIRSCGSPIVQFDEELWFAVIKSVTVLRDGGLAFHFRDGSSELVKCN